MSSLTKSQDKIIEIVADLFKEITELTDATDPAEDVIIAFRKGWRRHGGRAEEHRPAAIAMLDLIWTRESDPRTDDENPRSYPPAVRGGDRPDPLHGQYPAGSGYEAEADDGRAPEPG